MDVTLFQTDLHSTMLLLYPTPNIQIGQVTTHLHSTMLLLYPRSDQGEASTSIIYIPLCFYFIEEGGLYGRPEAQFTFHYASTLSPLRPSHILRILHLHSTMLLLYPLVDVRFMLDYIHLHSTMLLLYRTTIYSHISLATWFTFHYASTLSRPGSGGKIRKLPFTFHYASTLSEYAPRLRVILPYLHSTMLLLYLVGPKNLDVVDHDLHSTMLLLYRYPKDLKRRHNQHLHSTMLLLYQYSDSSTLVID